MARKTDKELEDLFDITAAEIESNAAPWEAGKVDGEPAGPVVMGRPLKFGVALRSVGFKDTEEKVRAIDKRAAALGVSRSDYLRNLVDKDLATV